MVGEEKSKNPEHQHVSSAVGVKGRPGDLVLLSGRDLEQLLQPNVAIAALLDIYRALALNRADQGQSLAFAVDDGSIHVKAGLMPGSHLVFAAKVNVNLPNNRALRGLPTIQGVVVLVDTVDGRPLAIIESMTLTAIRTAATAALAARYGARKESRCAAIIGCGAQAGCQLSALSACFSLEEVRVFDIDAARALAFARETNTPTRRCWTPPDIRTAVAGADICVTCTTAKSPVLTSDMDLRGCFIAAVGADNPEKNEIEPTLMARARLLVDDFNACVSGGDLSHALRAGVVTHENVHADLAELAAGLKIGRSSPDEIVIFDSTGSGVQDVAAACAAYRNAVSVGIGARYNLSGATHE